MLLRAAESADAMSVARVHVRSWQSAYRGLLPDEYLDKLRPEDRAQRYDFATRDPQSPHTIVAAEAGLIRGFATTAPSRDSDWRAMPNCTRCMSILITGIMAWEGSYIGSSRTACRTGL